MANTGSTFLALLTGAAIGAGVGMLYAPDRGEETRRRIGDNARRTQDNLNKQYREKSSNLSEQAKRARMDFETRLEDTLSSASFKADEILNGLESKLEELRRQNAKFQKNNSNGDQKNSLNDDQKKDQKSGVKTNKKDKGEETGTKTAPIKPSSGNASIA